MAQQELVVQHNRAEQDAGGRSRSDDGRGKSAGALLRLLLGVTLLGAFALRLYGLTWQDIWWDEARNLDVALRPLGEIATASELDIHPPLYFWLLHGWLRLANAEMGDPATQMAYLGRFLSVFAGVIGVALLGAWGRLLGGTYGMWTAALIGGLSPFWLAESQETRMYTVGLTLLLGAALALYDATLGSAAAGESAPGKRRTSLRARVVRLAPYVVFAAGALLVHYNVAFILAAWHVWWLLWALSRADARVKIVENIVAGAGILALVAPILPIALRQIPTYANPNLVVPTLWAYLEENWRAYFGGYAVDGSLVAGWGNWWLGALLGCMLLGATIALARLVKRDAPGAARARLGVVAFLLTWLVGGLLLYYVAVVDRGAFNVRYASFVTPALYLILAWSVIRLAQRSRVAGALATVLVCTGLAAASVADLTDAEYFREDVAGIVAWLEAEAGPEDVILVDQRYPFGFYWPGFADHPDAEPISMGRARARYLFVDLNALDERLNQYLHGAGRVFWVQWFESDTDPRRGVYFLLDQVGKREESRYFRGFAVSVWQLPPDFELRLADAWTPVSVMFDGAAEVVEMSAPEVLANNRLPVTLRWRQAVGVTPKRWKARVALYDESGARLAQSDERLLNDRHRFPAEWQVTDAPLNVYMLRMDERPDPGIYELRLLVYDEDVPDAVTWPHLRAELRVVDGVELFLGFVRVEDPPASIGSDMRRNKPVAGSGPAHHELRSH